MIEMKQKCKIRNGKSCKNEKVYLILIRFQYC